MTMWEQLSFVLSRIMRLTEDEQMDRFLMARPRCMQCMQCGNNSTMSFCCMYSVSQFVEHQYFLTGFTGYLRNI